MGTKTRGSNGEGRAQEAKGQKLTLPRVKGEGMGSWTSHNWIFLALSRVSMSSCGGHPYLFHWLAGIKLNGQLPFGLPTSISFSRALNNLAWWSWRVARKIRVARNQNVDGHYYLIVLGGLSGGSHLGVVL